MEGIILNGLSTDQLKELLSAIVRQEVENAIRREKENSNDQLLTVDATRQLFHPSITRQSLSNWSKRGVLKPYRLGRSVFYKKSEVFAAAKDLKKYSLKEQT